MERVLRTVSAGRPLSEAEARRLWKDGRVSGLFNVPNEDVFAMCVDFCIQESDSVGAIEVNTDVERLKNENRELREKSADIHSQYLLLEEAMAHQKSSSAQSKKDLKARNAALSKQLQSSQAELRAMTKECKLLKDSLEVSEEEGRNARSDLSHEREVVADLLRENRELYIELKKVRLGTFLLRLSQQCCLTCSFGMVFNAFVKRCLPGSRPIQRHHLWHLKARRYLQQRSPIRL